MNAPVPFIDLIQVLDLAFQFLSFYFGAVDLVIEDLELIVGDAVLVHLFAQIVENPLDPESMIILYAGLSGDATQKLCDLDADASYVIFDGDKEIVSGDWEVDEVDSDLVWKFGANGE